MQATESNAGGAAPESAIKKLEQPDQSRIHHVIAVMSGKGGVGKSSLSALLAVSLARKGHRVGLLDADITGPSIPKLFGLRQQPLSENGKIVPPETALGIKVISLNLLLANEDDPVIWRGPLIGGAVKQFWTDVLWGEIDYLVVDLPPGTGDAPLTVMQSLPLDGLLIVTSPQELAAMVVKKAIKMARMLEVPLLGLVENMSGLTCPHCGKAVELFGPSRAEEVAAETGVDLLGTIPLDPEISRLGDSGKIEQYRVDFLEEMPNLLKKNAERMIEQ